MATEEDIREEEEEERRRSGLVLTNNPWMMAKMMKNPARPKKREINDEDMETHGTLHDLWDTHHGETAKEDAFL